MTRAARLVLASQVALVVFLAACVVLHPGTVLVRNEGGVSNHGTHLETVLPYTLAFGLGALGQWRAARLLRPGGLARLLRTLAVLDATTLVTTYPYHVNLTWNRLHFAVGTATTLVERLAAPWLAPRVTRAGRSTAPSRCWPSPGWRSVGWPRTRRSTSSSSARCCSSAGPRRCSCAPRGE
jgi:hypothetical protein